MTRRGPRSVNSILLPVIVRDAKLIIHGAAIAQRVRQCVPSDPVCTDLRNQESPCLRGSFLPYPAGERPWPNMPHRAFQGSKYRPCGTAWQEDFTFRPSCAIDDCPVRRLKSSEGQLASGFPPGTDAEGLYEVLSPHVEEAPAPFTAAAAYSPRNPLMGSNPAAGGAQLWGIRSLVVAEVALAVMLILPAETYPDGAPVSFLQPVA